MTLSPDLHDIHAVIHRSFLAGEISEDTYFRGVVSISYGLVQIGCTFDAVSLLNKVSERYLQVVMPVEMEQDPEFCQAATKLAEALRAAGESIPAEEEILLSVRDLPRV